MKVYIDQEHIKAEVDNSLLEQLKKDEPCTRIDFSKKSTPENKEDFYKYSWKDNPERFEQFQERIIKTLNDIDKAIYEKQINENDGIIVGGNGQLVGLTGKATVHDWLVWYVKEYKKGE